MSERVDPDLRARIEAKLAALTAEADRSMQKTRDDPLQEGPLRFGNGIDYAVMAIRKVLTEGDR